MKTLINDNFQEVKVSDADYKVAQDALKNDGISLSVYDVYGTKQSIHLLYSFPAEKPKPVKVESVQQLKELSIESTEFFINLGGIRSSKLIRYDEGEKQFYIFNYIDDTDNTLTEEQLMNTSETNIGEAITNGNFYKD